MHDHDACHSGHCHDHSHSHKDKSTDCHSEEGWLNADLKKIILAAALLAAAIIIEKSCELRTWQLLIVYLVPYFTVGWETLKEAGESFVRGKALDEAFLMSIATVGALVIGFFPDADTQFAEAVFVMLFYQFGEYFEGLAEGKSRRSIAHLMDIRPDSANVERDGELLTLSPEEIMVGETIIIRPGEKVPMDGEIVEGRSSLDTVALTGESMPRDVEEGDAVVSGCVNLSGVLRARVTKTFGESTVAKILDLVENASENKSKSETFISRFAKVYTPIVVACAVALAFIPPIFFGSFSSWLYRACIFLVVSCPCALVISVPLSFFGGIGAASKKGILVKGSAWLESLSRVDTVVMDKTGTLTEGVFEVTAVHPEVIAERELLHLAAHVERYSTHPIALSLRAAYPEENDGCSVEEVKEIAGQGVSAVVNGRLVCVGNVKMMEEIGAQWHPCSHAGTIIHVSLDGMYVGHIVISDRLKEDARDAIIDMRQAGVKRTVMLTGDTEDVAAAVAKEVGLDEWHSGLLPAGKVEAVEMLLKAETRALAFVGDGINDAPVLARADVGIAMGGLGSDAAIEAADVVLMDDKPSKIAVAMKIARRTVTIARQNTWFAIGVKMCILVLAVFGIATMWLAVFGDVGVCFLAILNAMRALRA